MSKLTKEKFPTSLGVFSPTGHIVMAFATDGEAGEAERSLIDSGFKDSDVTHFSSDEVKDELAESEKQAKNPLQMGQDVVKAEELLELAREGAGFLIVRVAKGKQAKLAVAVARNHGLKFAEKYNWLTVEELV